MWKRLSRYDKFLLALVAVLALGTLLAPIVFLVLFLLSAFLGGIPLYMLFSGLPAVLAILMPARVLDVLLLKRVLPSWQFTGYVAIVLMLAISAVYAKLDNEKQAAAIADLTAGDFDKLQPPISGKTIAIIHDKFYRDFDCSGFCQRLLLTGQAKTVLVYAMADVMPEGAPDVSRLAASWTFETLPYCPTSGRQLIGSDFRIEGETAPQERAIDPADLIRVGAELGRCLVQGTAPLSEADLLIVDGHAARREMKEELSFKSGTELISAARRSVWVKTPDGLSERGRWSHVSAMSLQDIAVPIFGGSGRIENLRFGFGFWRNAATGQSAQPEFSRFVQATLGLELTITGEELPALPGGGDPLLAQLNASGTLSEPVQNILRWRLNTLSKVEPTSQAAHDLLMAIIADRRVALTEDVALAAGRIAEKLPPETAQRLAEIGLVRMHALLAALPDIRDHVKKSNEATEQEAGKQAYEVQNLAKTLAVLPESVLLARRDEIMGLLDNPRHRERVLPLAAALPAYGNLGAQGLVRLLIAATQLPPDARNRRTWMFGTGIRELCHMGPEAHAVLPEVLGLMKKVGADLGYSEISVIALLVALGHPEPAIRSLFPPAAASPSLDIRDRAIRDWEKNCYIWR